MAQICRATYRPSSRTNVTTFIHHFSSLTTFLHKLNAQVVKRFSHFSTFELLGRPPTTVGVRKLESLSYHVAMNRLVVVLEHI